MKEEELTHLALPHFLQLRLQALALRLLLRQARLGSLRRRLRRVRRLARVGDAPLQLLLDLVQLRLEALALCLRLKGGLVGVYHPSRVSFGHYI